MSQTAPISPGLHHVTAMGAGGRVGTQGNVDFHTGRLGLRLVKLTVNFDDPGTHHLYYGDASGRPGSVMTFFPWESANPGRPGGGETQATALAVPKAGLGYWRARLSDVAVTESTRLGETVLAFTSSEGLSYELIGSDVSLAGFVPNPLSDVPSEFAVRGFHGVTLRSRRAEQTAAVLTQLLGFREAGTEGGRRRFAPAPGAAEGTPFTSSGFVDVVQAGEREEPGRLGPGSVHHVAFRSRPEDHLKFIETVSAAGLRITPVQERCYFRSLYFREPGGVLFEIATDDPGFAVDEAPERLGTSLKLPPWLEPHRPAIEGSLPPVRLPGVAPVGF